MDYQGPVTRYDRFFTAYSITSAYYSDGLCITTSGPPIGLSPELSITKSAVANSNAFESSVTSLLRSKIGFSSCSGNGNLLYLPSDLIPILNTTSSPLPTNTTLLSTASNNRSSNTTISSAADNVPTGLTTKEKTATGVVVPAVVIIAFVLGMIFYMRRRRKRNHSGKDTNGSEEETQPYLQQKAEFEAEEKRRLELEAVEVRYEMDGGDHVNEIPGSHVRNEIDTVVRPQMPSLKETQELRGEECSKELAASSRPHSGTVS